MFDALNALAEEYNSTAKPNELGDELGRAMMEYVDTAKGTEARDEARTRLYAAANALELYAFKYGVRVGLQLVTDKIEE